MDQYQEITRYLANAREILSTKERGREFKCNKKAVGRESADRFAYPFRRFLERRKIKCFQVFRREIARFEAGIIHEFDMERNRSLNAFDHKLL